MPISEFSQSLDLTSRVRAQVCTAETGTQQHQEKLRIHVCMLAVQNCIAVADQDAHLRIVVMNTS
jgi:hypothetical protein